MNSTKGVDTDGTDTNAIGSHEIIWEDVHNMSELRAIVENEIEEVSDDLLLLIHAFILGLLSNKN